MGKTHYANKFLFKRQLGFFCTHLCDSTTLVNHATNIYILHEFAGIVGEILLEVSGYITNRQQSRANDYYDDSPSEKRHSH